MIFVGTIYLSWEVSNTFRITISRAGVKVNLGHSTPRFTKRTEVGKGSAAPPTEAHIQTNVRVLRVVP